MISSLYFSLRIAFCHETLFSILSTDLQRCALKAIVVSFVVHKMRRDGLNMHPQPLVLDAAEQNRMSAQLDWLMRIISPSPAWRETFRNQVAFLRDAKVTVMVRGPTRRL